MNRASVGSLLFVALLVMAAVPLLASFHLLEDTLRTSLRLGFNEDVVRVLEQSSVNLRALGKLDSAQRDHYRAQFEDVERLRQIYLAPELVSQSIEKPLKMYFGLGLGMAVLVSLGVATLLSRRVANSYRIAVDELLHEREQVRYLREMSSWQELAKMLAHEIKNPLTPIEVLVTSLSRAYQSKTSQEFVTHLNETEAMVAEELQQLKATVNKFSEFARLPQVQLTRVDVLDLLRQQLRAVSSTMPSTALELREPAEVATLYANIDTTLFRQVLTNLVRNGVEANPGREVRFTISIGAGERNVELSVMNDGDPVRAEIVPRIFDPYFSTHANKDNMGLGLAIVKKIVIEHHGDIRYEERDGQPLFLITLPRVPA
ncbi:sensor histidine kinase [Steroidobacter cummioxidans]|uniref:sensor histidine kinase n=1 Tax=Steroidobacter cummioxidans TaxID=1803913 RepID=UPI00137A1AC8|nr:ATP-binding protein [Steroidobacter cummioxidans]